MESNEIIKLIPPVLAEALKNQEMSIVGDNSGVRIIPSSSLLLISENGVSGFMAKQILDIKDMISKLGGEQNGMVKE
nr:MAG TPA: hypothetical protein [Caudoviricetes sp.]